MGSIIGANRFARVCLEESMKYAHKRRTFGQKLVDHQVIRHKLANMARQIEANHAWIEQIIYRSIQMGHEEAMMKLGGPIALLKLQATQTFGYVAREAAQIFGGLAYTRGGQGQKVEALNREVLAYKIPAGSEEYGHFHFLSNNEWVELWLNWVSSRRLRWPSLQELNYKRMQRLLLIKMS